MTINSVINNALPANKHFALHCNEQEETLARLMAPRELGNKAALSRR